MKTLLLIGLRYQDYTRAIIEELEIQGYKVSFHEIQPRSYLYGTLRVASPALYRKALDRHHRSILRKEAGKKYDVVLFIQAHQFSLENIDAVKAQHGNAKFVLYNWDSIRTHDYRPQMHAFESVFTFDPDDAKALGIGYLPLFCTRAFQKLGKSGRGGNAIYFVGNIVTVRRYEALRAFKSYCRSQGIVLNAFLGCSPLVFYRLVRAGFFPSDVSFFSIARRRFTEMIEGATTVFDFANHTQAGYTMRVVENLCAGKKIVTNNARILGEDFYSADRILVFTGLDFTEVKEFLSLDLKEPEKTFEEFHIQNFVRRLLD